MPNRRGSRRATEDAMSYSCYALRDRLAGGLFGLLVGDALGVPYEFHPPSGLPAVDAIDMEPPAGFRRAHHGVPAGTWSDDGAQALCLLASLLHTNGLDLDDFGRRLLNWLDRGYMAVDYHVFDVGIQTQTALGRLRNGCSARESGLADERHNGNGSLMRVLPLALWHTGDDAGLFDLAMQQSLPTHGHLRSQLACGLYCLWARHLLRCSGGWDEAVHDAESLAVRSEVHEREWRELKRLLDRPGIGTGYVVDSLASARDALEAGVDYAGVVRYAVSLGHDTDTTAAIAGGLAGIRHGRLGIPTGWLDAMRGRDLVDPLLDRLFARVAATGPGSSGQPRTSLSHPLQIGTLEMARTTGRIGVTFCPGKQQASAMTGAWQRDLDIDLAAIVAWGGRHLLTLVVAEELAELRVEHLPERAAAAGITWHHAPIIDGDIPDDAFEQVWTRTGAALHAALGRGESVVVHCKGGLGRAGTIAAQMLLERNECTDALDAIRRVRAVRPNAIENARQEQYLLTLARRRRRNPQEAG